MATCLDETPLPSSLKPSYMSELNERARPPSGPAALMDWLLETDVRLQGLTKTLHLRQRRLKNALNPAQYGLYLLIEETANERCFELGQRLYAVTRSCT